MGAQPNRAIASQPSLVARFAQFSGELKKLLQSSTNCHQRCRGTSLGGRSGWRQATPWSQSIGMGARRSRALPESVFTEPSLCRNCHRHRLRAPNPARSDLMPRDFFARLNTFAVVMDCRSPSSPFARRFSSSSGTPRASTASASRLLANPQPVRDRPVAYPLARRSPLLALVSPAAEGSACSCRVYWRPTLMGALPIFL